MGFDAFRRAQTRMKKKGGSGSRKPWQSYILTLDPEETAGIRFLHPNYEGAPDGFYVWKTHGWPKQSCTAEIPGFGGQCVYCYYNERSKEFREKYYPSKRAVACVVDFRYFHWDDSGNKTEVYACADAEPTPRKVRCRHCKSNNKGLAERHFGGQKRWELTTEQSQQVTAVYGKLAQVCVAQDDSDDADSLCGKRIDVVGYKCGNPSCGELIINEDIIRTHDISSIFEEKTECEDGCGESTWLTPVMVCEGGGSSDPDGDADHKVEAGSIFGKILEVTCSGVTETTRRGKRTKRSFNFDRNVAPWSHIKEDLAAFGLSDEEIEKVSAHDDLHKRFAPFRLDPSEYDNEEEYVLAVMKKQLDAINEKLSDRSKFELPPGYESESGGRSTGGLPWRRG